MRSSGAGVYSTCPEDLTVFCGQMAGEDGAAGACSARIGIGLMLWPCSALSLSSHRIACSDPPRRRRPCSSSNSTLSSSALACSLRWVAPRQRVESEASSKHCSKKQCPFQVRISFPDKLGEAPISEAIFQGQLQLPHHCRGGDDPEYCRIRVDSGRIIGLV